MKKYLIKPNSKLHLNRIHPQESGDYPSTEAGCKQAELHTQKILGKLSKLQERLFASASQSLLIVFQSMDTGGKDGSIKHVMRGFNPQGCKIASFKIPSSLERAHDFLWRVHQEVPPKGYIGIFNRSHYEEVLVTRVHGLISEKVQKKRFQEINDFENLLHKNGTALLKFFLHISKDEQKRRLEERARDPEKQWKFKLNDLNERKFWRQYQKNFEKTIEATSTAHAPWIVVPANHKWYRNLVVGKFTLNALEKMDLKFPPPAPGIDFKKLKIK